MSDEKIDATKLVKDLDPKLVEFVKSKLAAKIQAGLKPTAQYRGADIYTFGDNGDGYIFLYADGQVIYFVRYKKIRYSGWSLGRQVLLWSNPDQDIRAGGFAQHIFFKVLLPKYGALIADKEQTKNGSKFWSNAILGAFTRNLKVYLYDRRGSVSLTELKTEEEVNSRSHDLWGTDASHLYTFAVISTKAIKLKPKAR